MAGIFDASYLGVPVTGIFDTGIFDTYDGEQLATGCPSLTSTLLNTSSLTNTVSITASTTTTRVCE